MLKALLALFLMASMASAQVRTWTDTTGKHKTVAEFVELKDGKVYLKEESGRMVVVLLTRLCPADQEVSEKLASSRGGKSVGELDRADVVERVEPAVVTIFIDLGGGHGSQGSGVVVDSSGLVATNYHVIEGAIRARVSFQDKAWCNVSGYVAVAPGKDLALLQLEVPEPLPTVPLRVDLPRKGESVISFGAPQGHQFTVSRGIVSGIRSGKEVKATWELLKHARFDDDVTFIQTDASISRGNSGGPLVDMQGRVVGLNTWHDFRGESLNFAVGVSDVRALLASRGAGVRGLSELPGRVVRSSRSGKQPPSGPRPPPRIAFGKVKLPSGKVFSDAAVDLPSDWAHRLFPKGTSVYIATYPDGAPQGLYSYRDGKLHGPSAAITEVGLPRVFATYHDSRRDGPLRLYDERGRRILFAEYTRGRKNGLVCLFRGGFPWLIQEWSSDTIQQECLIRSEQGSLSAFPREKLKAVEERKELLAAQTKLFELETTITEAETELKKDLRDWYREEDKRVKQMRAAVAGLAKRKRMSARAKAAAAANAAAHSSMLRSSLQRSGF